MLKNIPMDKVVLRKWLRAGYVENGIHYPTRKGVPQGGIISPTISNMVLDGLEEAVRRAVPRRCRINFVRYADDFIITGKSKSILEEVHPASGRRLPGRAWSGTLPGEDRDHAHSKTDLRSSGKPSKSMAGYCTSRHRLREFTPSCRRWER